MTAGDGHAAGPEDSAAERDGAERDGAGWDGAGRDGAERPAGPVGGADGRRPADGEHRDATARRTARNALDGAVLRDGSGPGWNTHASYGTGPGWDLRPGYGRGNYEPGPGYRADTNYGVPPAVDGPQLDAVTGVPTGEEGDPAVDGPLTPDAASTGVAETGTQAGLAGDSAGQ